MKDNLTLKVFDEFLKDERYKKFKSKINKDLTRKWIKNPL